MAAAWRAFIGWFGLGKKEEAKKPVRYHPYDEISDDQLTENRRRPPRYHPYDEISDDQLEENRSSAARRASDNDLEENQEGAVSPGKPGGQGSAEMLKSQAKEQKKKARPTPKMRVVDSEANEVSGASGGSGLHYVEVEVQASGGNQGSNDSRPARASQPATIYSEVRPRAT